MKQTKVYKFLDQARQEAKKVVWPERKELITSVVVVIIAVFLFSLASLILDYGIHNIIRFFLNIGK
jgi:preprotein translocase subunit SecE